jgi:glutamate-ammonia-ligase adenylyltransferase
MDAAFTSIAFADTAKAEANLDRLEQRLPGKLWGTLPALLAQVPDPDAALNYLERYVAAASEGTLRFIARHPAALHHLLQIFAFSRFLSETVVHQPDLIQWLNRVRQGEPHGGLEHLKSPEDLHEEFARFESVQLDVPFAVVLARFKRREYVRIMLRDVLGLATLAETTLELSHLADVLLQRALRFCEQKLQNAYGAPQVADAAARIQPVSMAILSLGKLGARELNYNSDIDLMFLYASEGETAGGKSGHISNSEYFVRLAQSVLKEICEVTPEGAVFRVDLRLRPLGGEGDLAIALRPAIEYYRQRAQEWELQMLIKARCSAGDAEITRQFFREVHPLIFRAGKSTLDPNAVAALEAVLNARQSITRELQRRSGHAAEWNVKLSPGGIRDIEFLVQCLQRVHGGNDAWLAAPAAASTLVALQRLHDKGFLSGRDFFRLGTAYQFLRKVEHRLQLRDGLQRHTLPQATDALDRLARRCGIEPAAAGRPPGEQLLQRLRQHFAEVREIYARILLPSAERGKDSALASLASLEHGESVQIQRLRREYPALAEAATKVFAAAQAPPRRGLQRYLESAALNPECMAALEAHPEWVARCAEVFERSDWLAAVLARNPEEVCVLADPGLAAFRGPLGDVPTAAAIPFTGSERHELEAGIRKQYRLAQLAIAVRAVQGDTLPFETFEALSRMAEEAVRAALALVASDDPATVVPPAAMPISVLALGRLGSAEFDIGSDADLVFVTDDALSAEQREPWRRVAERLVNLLSSHTREGLLFPVDTRLRPHGKEGDILQPAASLAAYYHSEAAAWEAIAALKARPVAGNLALGSQAVTAIHEQGRTRFRDARVLAKELGETRSKLEAEGSALRGKGEFKKIAGGFYDIEYILGYLGLLSGKGSSPGQPAVAGNVLRQIAALESAGVMDSRSAQTIRSAAQLFRAVDHAIRIITGHIANRIPDPALAARIVALLEVWRLPLPGEVAEPPERLLAAISSSRETTRQIYSKVLNM